MQFRLSNNFFSAFHVSVCIQFSRDIYIGLYVCRTLDENIHIQSMKTQRQKNVYLNLNIQSSGSKLKDKNGTKQTDSLECSKLQ